MEGPCSKRCPDWRGMAAIGVVVSGWRAHQGPDHIDGGMPAGRGSESRKALRLLAERHAATQLSEHKLCKTPANQCTLTLLPFG